ncbi:MAG: hypothetical protein IPH16_14765 [Haliscomenobacter sp.]|nr:hypothetical protein [Haliscomenobacter sp.]MBK8878289.1 hypothetical protein [Haliscomenobacter sp.]
MQIQEVKSPKSWAQFFKVTQRVYEGDPNWIDPLEVDIRTIFNPVKNVAWKNGVAKCFVLLDDQGKPAGRITAFMDREANKLQPHPIGGVGFFECIPNPDYAHALFREAEQFLRSEGAKIIEGPVNFGERDKYWGLLVKGFEPPLYMENYNPVYYQDYFLKEGFIPFEQILTYAGASKNIPFERLAAVAKRLKERQPMYVEGLDYDHLDKFATDFAEVYNASFSVFDHFHPVSPELVRNMMLQAKPIADPHIAALAYYDKKPAGFIALYPDINPLLKHAKGKLTPWNLLVFLIKKAFKKTYNAKGMGFGIHPEFQSKGIFALLMEYLCSARNVVRYPYMYLAGIRAHNFEIRSVYSKLNVEVNRVHVMFRKPLEEGLEIKPFPFMEDDEENG